jgi:hypothetical protein
LIVAAIENEQNNYSSHCVYRCRAKTNHSPPPQEQPLNTDPNMALNQQAIDALANAMGRNSTASRLDRFTTGDAVGWIRWRRHFEVNQRFHRWSHRQSRQLIFMSMAGVANDKIADIDINDGNAPGQQDAADHVGLLTAYEQRFVVETATRELKLQFQIAAQQENEDVVSWHSRLRFLFKRTWPTINAANTETSDTLIDRFVTGLYDIDTRNKVLDRCPETYRDALRYASRQLSSRHYQQILGNVPRIKQEPQINALQAGNFRGGRGGGNSWRGGRGGRGGGRGGYNGNGNGNGYVNGNGNGGNGRGGNNAFRGSNRGGYDANRGNRSGSDDNRLICLHCKKPGHRWKVCRTLLRSLYNKDDEGGAAKRQRRINALDSPEAQGSDTATAEDDSNDQGNF